MFSSNTSQVSDDKLFVEDCFSCFLYTGNGSTQTITNGIDLAGKGGMVWSKARNNGSIPHYLLDSSAKLVLNSNTTGAGGSGYVPTYFTFNSNGYYVDESAGWFINTSGITYASWTFRKAPKFFDVVTYTGDGTFGRVLTHSLGIRPGVIIIKRTDNTGNWYVAAYNGTNAYYYSTASSDFGLNLTNSTNELVGAASNYFTSTSFNLSGMLSDASLSPTQRDKVNASGATYVAYLFAHDATADGIIQCGSFDGTAGTNVNLGWEPQWIMFKNTTNASNWQIVDNMRGLNVGSAERQLMANLSNAESDNDLCSPTATGFTWVPSAASNIYIYIAIRRGPMRTPTSGTSVFAPASQVGGGTITTNFPSDMTFVKATGITEQWYLFDKLRGSRTSSSVYLSTNNTNSETTSSGYGLGYDSMTTVRDNFFGLAYNYSFLNFRRAPSFFDEVCYTGTGSNQTLNHNLGITPELMIFKSRNKGGAGRDWVVWHSSFTADNWMNLNTTGAKSTYSTAWPSLPTATTYSISGTALGIGDSGTTVVGYLFGSAPGVSKIGSYTGNGSSQTINCGFAAGARFVMIKRTDSTGNWFVWDTARGIVSGNDPRLSLNTGDPEDPSNDAVDTDSSGFVVNQVTPSNINVSSAQYIYMAVA